MPITIDQLREAARRSPLVKSWTLSEARVQRLPTVFLCHSHLDAAFVKGVATLLEEAGWHVYVDWTDAAMPDTPTRETATRIQRKIVDLDFFLFLATTNSMRSRWCPWEIGYADGKKPIDRILILPTADGAGTHGSEYLLLYRRIDVSTLGRLAVWQPGDTRNGVFIEKLSDERSTALRG